MYFLNICFRTEIFFSFVKWSIFELLRWSFFSNTLILPVHSKNAYEISLTTLFPLRIGKNGYFSTLLGNTVTKTKLEKSFFLFCVFIGVPVVCWAPNFGKKRMNNSISIRQNWFIFSLRPHLHAFFGLFLKYHTFGHNSSTFALLFIYPYDLVNNIVGNQCLKGFLEHKFFSWLIAWEEWSNIEGKYRHNVFYVNCWNLFHNRILHEKICDFKKKSNEIRPTVQKLFNFE